MRNPITVVMDGAQGGGGQCVPWEDALTKARTDFERIHIRDKARALAAAAEVLKRRDIQTEASILVQDAERAIDKANPPKPQGNPSGKATTVLPEHGSLEPSVLRHIRQAHGKLTDDEYEKRKADALANQEVGCNGQGCSQCHNTGWQ